jgi:SPP1 gp7 family putative phage head morphogenesis protein
LSDALISTLTQFVELGLMSPQEATDINNLLDPEAGRVSAEQLLAAAIAIALLAQRDRLLDMVETIDEQSQSVINRFWLEEDQRFYDSISDTLDEVSMTAAASLDIDSESDSDALFVALAGWLAVYYRDGTGPGSAAQLNRTTRSKVDAALAAIQRLDKERRMAAFVEQTADVFGVERANLISATEVTRITTEVTRAAAVMDKNIVEYIWITARDESVCAVCAPRDGLRIAKSDQRGFHVDGVYLWPPAHVLCRCRIRSLTRRASIPQGEQDDG